MNATSNVTEISGSAERPAIDSLEFLSYSVGMQEYGIDMRTVHELRPYADVTRLADGSELVEGVVMSRGVIMPVVDMRVRGRVLASNDGPFPVLIVLNLLGRQVGMVVDKVADVVTVSSSQVTPPVATPASRVPDYLIGVGEIHTRKLILLDIEKLMARSIRSLAA